MATDPLRNRVVLFGGEAGVWLQDTWEWDGVRWIQQFPARTPYGRAYHAMSWNPATRRVAMFSRTFLPTQLLPVEEWDGTDWHTAPGVVVGGPALTDVHASAVPDPSGRGVLVIGINGDPYSATRPQVVYLWDGKHLTWQAPGGTIAERSFYDGLFLDKARREVVLYGGTTYTLHPGSATLRDTDVFDAGSRTWSVREPGGGMGGPPVLAHVPWDDSFLVLGTGNQVWRCTDSGQALIGPGPTYDGNPLPVWFMVNPATRRIFGLSIPNGFLYELAGTTWISIPFAQHGLPPLCFPAGFDAVDGTFVMIHAGAVKKWNGSTLSTITAIPGAIQVRGQVFDPDRRAVCITSVVGLNTMLHDWDGTSWHTTQIPPMGLAPWLSFMPGVGCVVADHLGQWAWNGSTWLALALGGPMPSGPWVNSLSAYDACRNRLRINGSGGAVYDDYWDLYFADLIASNPEPRPGTSVTLSVNSPPHAGQPWLLGLSPTRYPGIPLAGLQSNPFRVLPLTWDPLLFDTLSVVRGWLDPQGTGSVTLRVPSDPRLIGFHCFAAAISIDSTLRLGLVSRPVELYVAP